MINSVKMFTYGLYKQICAYAQFVSDVKFMFVLFGLLVYMFCTMASVLDTQILFLLSGRRKITINHGCVSPLSCVSCVPASCVHIWLVSCPCFMSLWVKYVPAVFVWLCVNYPLYISPVFWVWFRLVYLWLPGVSCLSALSCPALWSLKTIIWVYVLVCVFLFPPHVCTVTEDQTQP